MSNTELTKFYMELQQNNNKMPEAVYADIIPALNKHFNGQWTWELADERFYADNSCVCTTVTVYVPGRVHTGRSFCKIKDYASNHLFAILDACKSFISATNNSVQQNTQPNLISQQMTADQIMNAVQQQTVSQPAVDNTTQFYNYKGPDGISANGVPFDAITNNCHQELQQGFMNPPVEPKQESSNNADYNAPQERLKGFSQCQIDKLNQFKKDFDILNDEMFSNYVRTWNKELTSKKDITPANVDSFLQWIDDMGKMGC